MRSFHINFGSVKASAPAARGWSQAIDYATRQGEYAEEAGDGEEGPDVQHVAGSPDALRDACQAIDAGVRQRRGKTAERILVKETVELPSDVEDEQAAWKAGAEAIVADWKERGHEAVAAVHLHGEERDHPHLHVLVAARPMDADGGVDRSKRLLAGKAEVKAERANAAERINEACEPEIRFHPGKLKEIGIGREPKRRIPTGTFFRMRAEIEAANDAGDPERAREIEASMYAESATIREPLHAGRDARWQARKPEIDALKAAGEWPPKSQRAELEAERDELGKGRDFWSRAWKGVEKERKALKERAGTAEGRVAGIEAVAMELTDARRAMLADVSGRNGIEGPLDDPGVQLLAWHAFHREQEEREKRRHEAKEERDDDGRGTGEADRGADQGAAVDGTEARQATMEKQDHGERGGEGSGPAGGTGIDADSAVGRPGSGRAGESGEDAPRGRDDPASGGAAGRAGEAHGPDRGEAIDDQDGGGGDSRGSVRDTNHEERGVREGGAGIRGGSGQNREVGGQTLGGEGGRVGGVDDDAVADPVADLVGSVRVRRARRRELARDLPNTPMVVKPKDEPEPEPTPDAGKSEAAPEEPKRPPPAQDRGGR